MGEADRPDRLGVMFHVAKERSPVNLLRQLYVVGIPFEKFPNYATPEFEAALSTLKKFRVPIWLYFGDIMRCVHPSVAIRDVLLSRKSAPSEGVATEVEAWRQSLAENLAEADERHLRTPRSA